VSEDRIYAFALIAISVISTAFAFWVIFST